MRLIKGAISIVAVCGVVLCVTIAAVLGLDRALPHLVDIPQRYYVFTPIMPPGSSATFISDDFRYTAQANSLGLRGPEVNLDKGDAFRILVFGSSYVYGWGVEEEVTWVRQVEQQLRAMGHNVEVINLGRNGGNPEQYAALALEAIPLLKPDLVIVALGQGVDIAWAGDRQAAEKTRLFLLKYLPNFSAWKKMSTDTSPDPVALPAPQPAPTAEQLAAMQATQKEHTRELAAQMREGWTDAQREHFESLPETARNAFIAGRVNPGVIDLAIKSPNLYTSPLDLTSASTQEHMDYLSEYLQEIMDVSGTYGAACFAVSVPFGAYVNRPAYQNYLNAGFESYPEMASQSDPDAPFKAVCSRIGLPLLTVTDAFRAKADDAALFFPLDLHLAAPGQHLLANEVTQYIDNEHYETAT